MIALGPGGSIGLQLADPSTESLYDGVIRRHAAWRPVSVWVLQPPQHVIRVDVITSHDARLHLISHIDAVGKPAPPDVFGGVAVDEPRRSILERHAGAEPHGAINDHPAVSHLHRVEDFAAAAASICSTAVTVG